MLSPSTYETIESQNKEIQKSIDFGIIFFHCQIFEIFGGLEIDFSINVNKCFLNSYHRF